MRAAYRGYGEKGTLVKDTKFEEYYKQAQEVGLPVGVYIYSQAINTTEAEQEADLILSIINGKQINLPVVFDYEFADVSSGRLDSRWKNGTLDMSKMTQNALAFCKRVEDAGYTPMVYANASFLTTVVDHKKLEEAGYKTWLAHYTTSTSYAGKYDFWQYTDAGTINSISGKVFDANFWYISNESDSDGTQKPVVPETPAKIDGLYSQNIEASSAIINWTPLENVSGYEIQKQNANGSFSKVATATKATYNLTSLISAYDNIIRVRAYKTIDGKKIYGEFSDNLIITTYPLAVTISCTATSYNSATLKWTEQSGVSGTRIYKYNYTLGKYELFKELTGNAFTYKATGLASNQKHRFAIKTYKLDVAGRKLYSDMSAGLSVYTKPAAPNLISAKYVPNKKIKLNWSKVSGVSGYQIIWSTSSSFTGNKKTINAASTATTKTISTYYSKKNYYVKIRAYKVRNDVKYYSPWSKAIKVYIKK